MPFKSEAQRKYLWANEPAVARKFSKYNKGGPVMDKGLLHNNDVTVTIKSEGGETISYKSPKGMKTQMNKVMGGILGEDTVPAWLTPGEFVMNRPATMKYGGILEKMNNDGLRMAGYNTGGFVHPSFAPVTPREKAGEPFQEVGRPKSAAPGVRGSRVIAQKGTPRYRELQNNPNYQEYPNPANPYLSEFRLTEEAAFGKYGQDIIREDQAYANPAILDQLETAEYDQKLMEEDAAYARPGFEQMIREGEQDVANLTEAEKTVANLGEQDVLTGSGEGNYEIQQINFSAKYGSMPTRPANSLAVGSTATNDQTGEVWRVE